MAGPAAPAVGGTTPPCCREGRYLWDRGAVVGIGLGVRVSAGLWVTAGGSGHHCSHGWWHWTSWGSGQLLSRPP